jgi:hypothetical protein
MPAKLRKHAWEHNVVEHPWEGNDVDDYDVDGWDPLSNPAAAAMEMLEVLLDLYMNSQISAMHFCTTCYWACKAGISEAEVYGFAPGKASGAYQAHLDRVLGNDFLKRFAYSLSLPGSSRGQAERSIIKLPCKPVHEAADDYMQTHPEASIRLAEAIQQGELPRSYTEHCIVKAYPDELVMPWGLYMDAVPYSLTDSCIGCWLINLITGFRAMLCILRKKLVCCCGCRGWCTYYNLMMWLRWGFDNLADNQHATSRHDGRPWDDRDYDRAAAAGQRLKHRGILLRIKGDWEEFCVRLGFPTWASGTRPCFCCAGSGMGLYDLAEASVLSLPWPIKNSKDYDDACTRCEIWVLFVDVAARNHISQLLEYDRRQNGQHGRVLIEDVPCLSLKARDRLEPSTTLPDVGMFEQLILPVTVLFWRVSQETLCNHRCPLFSDRIGVNPCDTISLDLLHTLYLGPLLLWSRKVIWLFLLSLVWARHENTMDGRIKTNLKCFKAELVAWYEAWDREHRSEGTFATRLCEMTSKMLGTPNSPRLKIKAMECYFLMLFMLDLLVKNRAHVGDHYDAFVTSGTAVKDYLALLKASPMNLDAATRQKCFDLWAKFVNSARLVPEMDIDIPKSHLMIHVNNRSEWHGNPWRYTTFLDESLNKEFKRVLRNCHQCNFENLAMFKLSHVLEKSTNKRQRTLG